jgi:hypothetical protein
MRRAVPKRAYSPPRQKSARFFAVTKQDSLGGSRSAPRSESLKNTRPRFVFSVTTFRSFCRSDYLCGRAASAQSMIEVAIDGGFGDRFLRCSARV